MEIVSKAHSSQLSCKHVQSLIFNYFYCNVEFLVLGNVVWDDENTTKRAYNAESQESLPKSLLKIQENDSINASDGNYSILQLFSSP